MTMFKGGGGEGRNAPRHHQAVSGYLFTQLALRIERRKSPQNHEISDSGFVFAHQTISTHSTTNLGSNFRKSFEHQSVFEQMEELNSR